ncbi:MAG TPA: hypothetical protein VFB81_15080 [Myxococcales bacterium]|nr:hypothetical protein [Myxococcales bacterium]
MPDSVMAVTHTAPDRVTSPEPAPERSFASPVERLSTLLQKADAATGDARRSATGELNELLGQMSRFASRPVADLLLRWLDQGSLTDLEDGDGQTARAAATAAVLSMGYPYALEISPDDLDHLREHTAPDSSLGGSLAATLVVGITSAFAGTELVAQGWRGHLSHMGALLAVIGTMIAVALTRARGSGRRWALLSLLLSGLVAMSFAVSESSVLLFPAIGAIIAFAMAWPRRGS